jgi:arylsulfatase A-like enzyme
LNKQYLEPYNEEVVFTPNISRFAHESIVFNSHYTEGGLSGTDFASILSGTQADRHGVFKQPRKLHDDLSLIFEAFSDAGFETFYWNAHPMASPEFNYAQGVRKTNIIPRRLDAGDPRFKSLLEHLEQDKNFRALVVTTFTVTHGPYHFDHLGDFLQRYPALAGSLTEEEIRKYYRLYRQNFIPLQTQFDTTIDRLGISKEEVLKMAEVLSLVFKSRVHFLDQLFGELLTEIDRHNVSESSIIVFTADHGETFYREDRPFKWTHGPDLAQEVIEVPLMIRATSPSRKEKSIDNVTRSIDLYPTLAALSGVGVPPDAEVQGVDLSAALRGEAEFPELRAYSHGTLRQWSFYTPDVIENIRVSVREGTRLCRWQKGDASWQLEVFNLASPETAAPDVYDADDPLHKDVIRDLLQYKSYLVRKYREGEDEEAKSREEELNRLSDEEREALESLGYIE